MTLQPRVYGTTAAPLSVPGWRNLYWLKRHFRHISGILRAKTLR
jgi:hypothetical protein